MSFDPNSSSSAKKNNKNTIISKKNIKEIKRIIYLLTSLFLFLVFWTNKSKLYPENVLLYLEVSMKSFLRASEFPTEVNGNAIPAKNIKLMGSNIALLSDTSFTLLNKSAYKIRELNHNLKNPSFKAVSMRAILYDIGGKKLRIESQPKTLHTLETENNIISADISESGNYSILTESQSYLSELSVYSRQNAEKYKYYFSEMHACDVALSPRENKGAVCGIYIENGFISSNVYVLNFKSEKPENIFKLENNLVSEVKYFSNGNILAIGDNYLSVINPNTGNFKTFNYDEKLLKSYSFDKDYGFCCCLSPSINKDQNDEIRVIDNFGKSISQIVTDQNFKSLSHYKNRIFTVSSSKLTAYTLDGQYEGYLNIKNIYENILAGSGSFVYLLGSNTIDKVRVFNLKRA